MYSTAHVGLPLGNIGSADEFQYLRLSTSKSDCTEMFIPRLGIHKDPATESWAGPGNEARSCWLPDTLALFPGSCAQELGEKTTWYIPILVV